jgi:hypothetical protein
VFVTFFGVLRFNSIGHIYPIQWSEDEIRTRLTDDKTELWPSANVFLLLTADSELQAHSPAWVAAVMNNNGCGIEQSSNL